MDKTNITREEARERSRIIRKVHSYDISLDLTGSSTTFATLTTVKFSATAGAATWIDAITAKVRSIVLNGKALDPTAVSDGFRIQLADLAPENELTVTADMFYTNSGEGLHRFVDPVDDEVYLYSQFEVPDSRRMYPVFEQPDLKSRFTFTVTAPTDWSVISNSKATATVKVTDTVSRWTFAPTETISSYITALIAGPYRSFHSEAASTDGRSIPLGLFARKSLAEYVDADDIFKLTRQGFAFYEDQFKVPYPFSKYDQLFVPEFNAGAMENAGAVTITETYVFRSKVTQALIERRAITILHELAHMWFGDLVTMRWWNDLWLNESFAEYMSHLAAAQGTTDFTDAWTTFAATEKSWAYRQDQLPSTHPIVAEISDLNDVLVNFDGITYAKGASVLKQLVSWTGQKNFMEALRRYFGKHAFGNTELKDLMLELEAASGRQLRPWGAQWLETAGVNTLTPHVATDENDIITDFTIEQTAPDAYPTLRSHRLAIGFYAADGTGKLTRKKRMELDVSGRQTRVDDAAGLRHPASSSIVLLNDDDLTFAKIRLDERSWDTVLHHLKDVGAPLPRAVLWGAAWDSTRDAQLPVHNYVRLILDHIGDETDSSVITLLLRQLHTTLELYVPPALREETVTASADDLWKLADRAQSGSDHQFQFLKAFSSHARTSGQLDILQDLFDGKSTLKGLPIDTDLRWELLTALVVNGRQGEEAIARQLSRDDTASGRLSAATARAAIPTAGAKAEAWQKVVVEGALPNAVQRAMISGFNRVTDQDILTPFASEYFDSILDIWSNRPYELAQQIIVGLYPAVPVMQETLTATDSFLAHLGDQHQALARLIKESKDGVARALKVQAASCAEKIG